MDLSQRIRTIITDKNGRITVVYKKLHNDLLFRDGYKVPIHDEELSKKLTEDNTYSRHYKDQQSEDDRYDNVIVPILNDYMDRASDRLSDHPTVVFLAGGGGSGKGHVLKQAVNEDDFVTVNNDHIKELIPEYEQFQKEDIYSAAPRVHEESSVICRLLLDKLSDVGANMVYDATCSNTLKTMKLINMFKSKGYKIKMVGVLCDPEIAMQSAYSRFIGKKRYVPSDVIKCDNYGARMTMEEIVKDKDIDVELYDNNEQLRGGNPVLFYKSGSDVLNNLDPLEKNKGYED